MTYYYETEALNGHRMLIAKDDETAIKAAKERKAILLYQEEKPDKMRIVWENKG